MSFDRAMVKVSRWVERQPGEFTKQRCWQATRGGTVKTSADLDTILGVLVQARVIEPIDGRRSLTYRVAAVAESPAASVTDRGEESPPAETNPLVGDAPQSSEYAAESAPVTHHTCPRVGDADVLTLASQRRRWDGRIDHLLGEIEKRHGKSTAHIDARNLERGLEDQRDLAEIRKWLGTEPSFTERFTAVANRLKELPDDSPLLPKVRAVTHAVRLRNDVVPGASLPMGFFNLDEVAQLEAILDGSA